MDATLKRAIEQSSSADLKTAVLAMCLTMTAAPPIARAILLKGQALCDSSSSTSTAAAVTGNGSSRKRPLVLDESDADSEDDDAEEKRNNEDEDDEDEDEEDSDSSGTQDHSTVNNKHNYAQQEAKKRKLTPMVTPTMPRYAKCRWCDIDFDMMENNKKVCGYHEGSKEANWDSEFWADWDEDCHGRIDDQDLEYPEGFEWSCCGKPGDAPPCVRTRHEAWFG